MPTITVDEWESGRYWRGNQPVMVANVTAGWAANENWKLDEMLKRYPDAEATMGDGRRVGKIGPDAAGRLLSPTTVKVRYTRPRRFSKCLERINISRDYFLLLFNILTLRVRSGVPPPHCKQMKEFITKHMYNPFKYFFDRKIAIPKGMLEDCRPFPLPTRKYLDDPLVGSMYAPSRKRRVNPINPRERWRDHLAIAIGADLQGLSFHYHGAAWNTVIFGKKRWILYDPRRWMDNEDEPNLQRRLALAEDDAWDTILPTAEWIRQLYPDPWRTNEIRTWGMDCIQHAGTMMYVPKGWMHMVVNIGDTVSVISEVGLDMGKGKTAEDFLYDPDAKIEKDSEDDSEDDDSDDDDESSDDEDGGKGSAREGRGDPIFNDGGPPPVRGQGLPRRSRARERGLPPPRRGQDSSDDDSGDIEDSEDAETRRPRKFKR
jgi:hypothetical protein